MQINIQMTFPYVAYLILCSYMGYSKIIYGRVIWLLINNLFHSVAATVIELTTT